MRHMVLASRNLIIYVDVLKIRSEGGLNKEVVLLAPGFNRKYMASVRIIIAIQISLYYCKKTKNKKKPQS